MTPRAHRRKLAAAALAAACVIIYLWMLFAWETAWGIDLKHRDAPPWLVGTFWELQWAVACAALVLLAALCAAAEGLEMWKRPPRYKGPRMFRVGDNASRVGLLALLLVACRVISLHAVSHHVGGRRGRAPSARVSAGAAGGDDAAAVLGSGLGFLAAAYAVAWRKDAPFARHGKYLFDRRKDGNPNVVSGGLSLIVCAAAAFVGAVIALAVSACIRRRRRRTYRSADVELKEADAGAAAELVFATVGARPDLGDILRRANEELGADADVLIGGPQRLVDGLEDRLRGRVVERMTWAM